MATLNRKLAQITDTHLALKNENTRLAKRLAEVEVRPVFVE
ncbi:hypothetical protein OAL00_04840 [Verrucomicrobiales bacterium]|nr:hypothetical protein [Verrucomicrobiales bacterium]